MNNDYYVYLCYVEGVVKYVGMGKEERYKHCTSGTSSCGELNRDFFQGKKMEVVIIHNFMNKNEAAYKEAEVIESYPFDQLYNKQRGKRKNLKGLDKMLDHYSKLVQSHKSDYVTIRQAKRWIDNASFHADYPVRIYGYIGLDGWQGLSHKVASLFGLTPEIVDSKYCYKIEKLTFEQLQGNFRTVIK